jgi:hypothetical protein
VFWTTILGNAAGGLHFSAIFTATRAICLDLRSAPVGINTTVGFAGVEAQLTDLTMGAAAGRTSIADVPGVAFGIPCCNSLASVNWMSRAIDRVTIGPRQTMGVSTSIRKPIDIACKPCPSIGSRLLPSLDSGRPVIPSIIGWEGP